MLIVGKFPVGLQIHLLKLLRAIHNNAVDSSSSILTLTSHHCNNCEPRNPISRLGFRVFFSSWQMSSGRPPSAADGDMRMVAVVPERLTPALPPRPPASAGGSNALVEYVPPGPNPEEEDLEIKLRRIIEHVPVRVSNTSGSSAGSGSGDFHQYRQMRRKEQDRLARMDADYQKRKEVAEFNMRREERMKAAEERSEKKRLKRLKKKQRKKEKKRKLNTGGEEHRKEESSEDDGDSDDGDKVKE